MVNVSDSRSEDQTQKSERLNKVFSIVMIVDLDERFKVITQISSLINSEKLLYNLQL